MTDIIYQPVVSRPIALDFLALSGGQFGSDLDAFFSVFKNAFQAEKHLSMPHQLLVRQTRVAFAKAQKMHCVQHVGLAHAIQAREAVEPGGELQRLRFVVFEIGEFE